LSRYLDTQAPNGGNSPLGDWLLGRAQFKEVVRQTPYEGLSYVPTTPQLISDSAIMEQAKVKSVHYLRQKVEALRASYDFILIDTQPSFSILLANSLVAADQVLIPFKLDALSNHGLPDLINNIHDVQDNIKSLDILGALGTFDRKGVGQCERSLAEIHTYLPGKVLAASIHLNSKLADAAETHKPIQHYDRSCQGFTDYENLTTEVLAKCQRKVHAPLP
jgi:chromosome partitioning protein